MNDLEPQELLSLAEDLEEASLKLSHAAHRIQMLKEQASTETQYEATDRRSVYTPTQYAAYTGYSVDHIRQMIRDGRLRAYKLDGGARWLIPDEQPKLRAVM